MQIKYNSGGLIKKVRVTPDGKYLITGDFTNKIRITQLKDGVQIYEKKGEPYYYARCSFDVTSDSKYLICKEEYRFATIIRIKDGTVVHSLPKTLNNYCQNLCLSPDGKFLVYIDQNIIKFMEMNTFKLRKEFRP